MPYKNHHVAVVTTKTYAKYRRDDWGHGRTAACGINDESELHEVLFDSYVWTVEKAKAWLKEHKVSYRKFYKATGKGRKSGEKREPSGKKTATYTCECLECGHVIETNEHCRDVKCPKCGGEMRRIERPGPGQRQQERGEDAERFALSHNSELGKNEPRWGTVDKTKLPRAAFAVKGDPAKKSTWGYPHHWVQGGKVGKDGVYASGTMYLHRGGLAAAWQRANQQGNSISASAKAHLNKHRKDIGMGEKNTEVPAKAMSFSLERESVEFLETKSGKRRMRVLAQSGQPLTHWYWGNCAFDLRGLRPLKETIPALREHDVERVVGVFDTFKVQTNKGWVCEGEFIESEDAKDLLAKHDQGVPYEASIRFDSSGFRLERVEEGAKTEVNGYTFEGPGVVFRETPVREASYCLFGADHRTAGKALADEATVTLSDDAFVYTIAEGGEEVTELTQEERQVVATEFLADLSAEEFAELAPAELMHSVKALGKDEGAAAAVDRAKELYEAVEKDAAFAFECLVEGKSLDQARLEYAEKKRLEAEERAKKAEEKLAGVEGAVDFNASDSEAAEQARKGQAGQTKAAEQVEAKLREYMKADNSLTRAEAVMRLVEKEPELHKAWLAEVNA